MRRAVEGSHGVHRLEAFSDGVFAIAGTLLFFQIAVPQGDLLSGLASLGLTFFSVGLSFIIIGLFWIAHHRAFTYIVRVDDGLLAMNLILLLTIAILPFATTLLGRRGNERVAVVFYALCMTAAGLMSVLVWVYATTGRRLVEPDLRADLIRYLRIRSSIVPLVFAISVGVAFIDVSAARALWVLVPAAQRAVRRAYAPRQ